MGATKYGIVDKKFLPAMLGAAKSSKERGLVLILYYTGMHLSSVNSLTMKNLVRQGKDYYIRWVRPKTRHTEEALVPKNKLDDIKAWLTAKKVSNRMVDYILRRIGDDAGYSKISQMTFRHTRCMRLIESGVPLVQVAQMMGCSINVVIRAYSRLSEKQLAKLQKRQRIVI